MKGKSFFGKNLKHLLKSQGYTYSEFAKEFGVKGQAIGKWVKGTSEPNYASLMKIRELLNVSIDDLFLVDMKAASRKVKLKSRAHHN